MRPAKSLKELGVEAFRHQDGKTMADQPARRLRRDDHRRHLAEEERRSIYDRDILPTFRNRLLTEITPRIAG